MKKFFLVISAMLLAAFALTACSSAPAAPTVELGSQAILIDVRTQQEFSEGHLQGANVLDLNSGEFAAVLPNLDPNAEYYVYCRSGNRSTQATQMMQQAGFTNVTNLGSVQEASKATGIPVVK